MMLREQRAGHTTMPSATVLAFTILTICAPVVRCLFYGYRIIVEKKPHK